jgi:oxygen-independent coproporphyrinogen-3 oxidase
MGYTVRHAADSIGCGMSAISDTAGGYFQNESKLIRYQRAVDDGRLATARGVVLTEDDHLRRYVITALMCASKVSIADVEARFGIDFQRAFATELEALRPMADDGFVEVSDEAIHVVGHGRLFVRNVCMVFDAHLRSADSTQPRFSRTV